MEKFKRKMSKVDITTAIKKCDNKYGPWCGYLRPDEIVKLVEQKFIIPNKWDNYKVLYAQDLVNIGRMNPMWFYFQPRKAFLEIHRGYKRRKNDKI